MSRWSHPRRLWPIVVLALQACLSAQPAPPSPPAFLRAAPREATALRVMAREQEQHLASCAGFKTCDRAHYIRALLALYEDRAVAARHFHAVVAGSPGSRYVASSRQWLRLLADKSQGTTREAGLTQAMGKLVRDLIDLELAVQASLRMATETKPDDLQNLRQQLKERDKRIEELIEQIEALKRVDEEVTEQVKPTHPTN